MYDDPPTPSTTSRAADAARPPAAPSRMTSSPTIADLLATGSLTQCETCGVERDLDRTGVECDICTDEREGSVHGRNATGSAATPCPICADERQYLPADGRQRWTDPGAFRGEITLSEREAGLWAIDVSGGVGIGQQAKIIATAAGNVMVDVPAAISDDAVAAVRALGPLAAIIPTHPHMFGVQSLWSRALGDAPIYVAEADAEWLGHVPSGLRLFSDAIEPVPGVTASQPGGHFPGSVVVHFAGADGAGVLLAGDTIAVNPDLRTVAFMWSYPNRVPLSAAVVMRIAAHVDRYEFDRLYSNFGPRLASDAKARVLASARRHAAWVWGEYDHLTGLG